MSNPNRVYFIKPKGRKGPIKIGCSSSPATRLDTLSAWSPYPLEVIGTIGGSFEEERFLHECFADLHTHREWFKASPVLSAAIAKVIAAGSVDAIRNEFSPKGSIRNSDRRKKSESEKLLFSYESRIRNVTLKLRNAGLPNFSAPDDVDKILRSWRREKPFATPPDLSRLDAFIADPKAHAVIPAWKRPKDSICIPIFDLPEQPNHQPHNQQHRAADQRSSAGSVQSHGRAL